MMPSTCACCGENRANLPAHPSRWIPCWSNPVWRARRESWSYTEPEQLVARQASVDPGPHTAAAWSMDLGLLLPSLEGHEAPGQTTHASAQAAHSPAQASHSPALPSGLGDSGPPTQSASLTPMAIQCTRPSLEVVRFTEETHNGDVLNNPNISTTRGSLSTFPLQGSPIAAAGEFIAAASKPLD